MPERIANKIILTEDREQQNLVRYYLQRCGHSQGCRFAPLPAKSGGGSGEKYVRDHYAEQVKACRSSLGRKAAALLVVIVDADMETTQRRAPQLADKLKEAAMAPRGEEEPIVVLIPKRHVETWIQFLRGNTVDEATDYTKAPFSTPTKKDITQAAEKLYKLMRPNANPDPSAPPSLTASIPEWRKI